MMNTHVNQLDFTHGTFSFDLPSSDYLLEAIGCTHIELGTIEILLKLGLDGSYQQSTSFQEKENNLYMEQCNIESIPAREHGLTCA